MSNELHGDRTNLRYLDAAQVEHPSGTLAGVTMWNGDIERIGLLSGVLVEPCARRVRYFVVERGALLRRHEYLIAAETPAVLDTDSHALRVDVDSEPLQRFDRTEVPSFSDTDLVEAMFARPAA